MGQPSERPTETKLRPRSARLKSDQIFAALIDTVTGADQAFGVVRNVSSSGIGLITPQPPHKGARITAKLSVGEQMFELRMRVARSDPDPSGQTMVGLSFERHDEQRKAFLKAFLADGQSKSD
ncbi:MAG: PilZ domain-containing protein [Planctomycetota bacterium]